MLTDFAGSHADYRAWLKTITHTHRRRIVVTLTDLEHAPLANLTPRFIKGEVSYDVTRQPTRVLTLELLDPTQSLQFEPDSPGSMPLHFARMIRIGWSVYVPSLERWVTCPVFTGPVTDFDRNGVVATITAEGKERLALGEAGRSRVFPKKTKKIAVIRGLLEEAGETRFDLAEDDKTKTSIPEPITVRSGNAWWTKARTVASSMDHQLFYAGRGVATLRRITGKVAFTFDAKTLATDIVFDRDPTGIRNRWIFTGAKPRGQKQRIHVDLRLPPSHPLSGQSLGRNGKPRWLIDRTENAAIKTTAEAMRRARRRRDDAIKMPTNYSFDTLPIPHLEENDMVRVASEQGTFVVRMRTWTLPLSLEGAPVMTVGSLRRTTVTTRRLRGGAVPSAQPVRGGGRPTPSAQPVRGLR